MNLIRISIHLIIKIELVFLHFSFLKIPCILSNFPGSLLAIIPCPNLFFLNSKSLQYFPSKLIIYFIILILLSVIMLRLKD